MHRCRETDLFFPHFTSLKRKDRQHDALRRRTGTMGKYERRWHSPYYWDGWDAPGSNLTSISRGKCPTGSPPSIECPRCQENPRAGACPEPGPMADLMRLFPRVLIICGGFECARHAGGYWPQDVQAASTSKPSPDWPRLAEIRATVHLRGESSFTLGMPAPLPQCHPVLTHRRASGSCVSSRSTRSSLRS